jgi:hypothetical protein
MDNESLSFGGLVMGGWSLVGRQDQIFSQKHHGGALDIWLLRMHRRGFGFVHQFLIPT